MKAAWHRIQHALGLNHGYVWSICDRDGRIWVGFECSQCGEINGVHEARSRESDLDYGR